MSVKITPEKCKCTHCSSAGTEQFKKKEKTNQTEALHLHFQCFYAIEKNLRDTRHKMPHQQSMSVCVSVFCERINESRCF